MRISDWSSDVCSSDLALATEAALPGEVVSLIKAGKQSGVIPASDAKFNELLKSQTERMGDEESTLTAYAQKPSTLSNPRVAGAPGDAMVGYGRDWSRSEERRGGKVLVRPVRSRWAPFT